MIPLATLLHAARRRAALWVVHLQALDSETDTVGARVARRRADVAISAIRKAEVAASEAQARRWLALAE